MPSSQHREVESTKVIVCNRDDMTPNEYRFQTFQGKKWALYNKGGAYSPFYSDIDLVVNWENDGKEIWNFVDETGFRLSRPRGDECYFKPGLSWALRTRRFSPYVVPAGCILSLSRYEIFAHEADLEWILGLLNGSPVTLLLKISSERYEHPKFIEGIVAKLPFPNPSREEKEKLMQLARNAIRCVQRLLSVNETSHLFRTIGILYSKHEKLAERALEWQTTVEALHEELLYIQQEIDTIVCHLYGIESTDRSLKELETSRIFKKPNIPANIEGNESEDEVEKIETSYSGLTANLISYSLGCVFGHWDIRIGLNPTLVPESDDSFAPLPVCSLGTLISPRALPASSNYIVSEEWMCMRTDYIKLPREGSVKQPTVADEEYPVRIAWDGILVDDPGHSSDIVQCIREVLAILWPSGSGTQTEEIEPEICKILAVKELREYFRRPSGFFDDHLKCYSKSKRQAPIYWPLSTASGSYTIWIYYHRLTSDTLFRAMNRYVEPKIIELQGKISELERRHTGTSGREATHMREEVEDARSLLVELQDFREEMLRVAALPYHPDLNDGVIINAAPLYRLFRLPKWAKDTKACWEKLQRGEYDWAHQAYTIWPDRVREKCRTDRSLAIAHDLEHLYVEQPTVTQKKRSRKAVPDKEDEE